MRSPPFQAQLEMDSTSTLFADVVPLFPLSGTILLPNTVLPLHIFEPRYRQMVESVSEKEMVIGMIQPVEQDSKGLYKTGCLGKIEQLQQLPNGNYMLQLHGSIRFNVVQELEVNSLYRQAQVDYTSYEQDLDDQSLSKNPEKLYEAFRHYTEKKFIQIEWQKIEAIPVHYLVNILCMNLDFSCTEKQALLEAPNLSMRWEYLLTLMEMAVAETTSGTTSNIQIN